MTLEEAAKELGTAFERYQNNGYDPGIKNLSLLGFFGMFEAILQRMMETVASDRQEADIRNMRP